MFNKELVKSILSSSVKAPEAFDWSIQGFGMLRLYLSNRFRLHVWSPNEHCFTKAGGGSPLFVPETPDNIHDHHWDFTSHIIAGAITNVKYIIDPAVDSIVNYTRRSIICGPGGSLKSDPPVNVRLLESERTTYTTGQSYSQRSREIHESNPLDGTVTLTDRSFEADHDRAFVFSPLGQPWKSAEPKPATAQEIWEICQLALKNWF